MHIFLFVAPYLTPLVPYYVPLLSTNLRLNSGLQLYKSALFEFIYPASGVSLCHLVVDTIVLSQELGNPVDAKLATLDCSPKVQRTLVKRYNLSKIFAVMTLHNHHVLASHLSNFVLILNLHTLSL